MSIKSNNIESNNIASAETDPLRASVFRHNTLLWRARLSYVQVRLVRRSRCLFETSRGSTKFL